jgi:hypothetical protein
MPAPSPWPAILHRRWPGSAAERPGQPSEGRSIPAEGAGQPGRAGRQPGRRRQPSPWAALPDPAGQDRQLGRWRRRVTIWPAPAGLPWLPAGSPFVALPAVGAGQGARSAALAAWTISKPSPAMVLHAYSATNGDRIRCQGSPAGPADPGQGSPAARALQ